MYQFSDSINYDVFFRFDKRLIRNMNWALLPSSSKAVFPVIGVHCNEAGNAFPTERTIAIMSGRSDKIVREGIKGLEDFPGFRVQHYITARGKRAKRFQLKLPPTEERGRAFPFHKSIIEGGNWSMLKPTAQALYPVMRSFGYFDFQTYCDLYDLEYEPGDFDEIYRERKCDFCEAEVGIMAKYAGISLRSISNALEDLQARNLIEAIGINDEGNFQWKVFLKPHRYFKRSFLNQKVMERYHHAIQP
jgi:hypothetical protein